MSIEPNGDTARFKDTSTGATATLAVDGPTVWGWELLYVDSAGGRDAVIEHDFNEWSFTAYVTLGSDQPNSTFRKPIGVLSGIEQPRCTGFSSLERLT